MMCLSSLLNLISLTSELTKGDEKWPVIHYPPIEFWWSRLLLFDGFIILSIALYLKKEIWWHLIKNCAQTSTSENIEITNGFAHLRAPCSIKSNTWAPKLSQFIITTFSSAETASKSPFLHKRAWNYWWECMYTTRWDLDGKYVIWRRITMNQNDLSLSYFLWRLFSTIKSSNWVISWYIHEKPPTEKLPSCTGG